MYQIIQAFLLLALFLTSQGNLYGQYLKSRLVNWICQTHLCALISCVLYTCYFSFKNHHFIPAYIVVFSVSRLHQFKFL